MTDLTEQWKKGELDRNKVYYYETPFQTIDTASGFWLCNSCDKNDKITVFSEVPSYEEWQANESYIDYLKQCISVYESKEKQHTADSVAYSELVEENSRLKETLKKTKANGHYPDRISRLKSRVVATSEENTKLKEVLKESQHIIKIEKDFSSCHFEKTKLEELLSKINQVLGEE